MSIITQAMAPCSKCGCKSTINVYKSINTKENPELISKVKDGSIFLWECPECKTMNLARYETLYHDPEKKLMVWLIPDGEISETQMQAITMHTKAMGGYTLRRVSDMGDLMEKVLINDSGLDDSVLEMCKYVTKIEMIAKITDQDKQRELISSTFHFYHTEGEGDDRLITFMYAMDGKMQGVNIGWNVYVDCIGIVERNPIMKPADGFEKIDADWLYSKMK